MNNRRLGALANFGVVSLAHIIVLDEMKDFLTSNIDNDAILTLLQEIIEAWNAETYKVVVEKCILLLKRKKTLQDYKLTIPLQRVLLQAWLHQDEFAKVIEWASSNSNNQELQDLILRFNLVFKQQLLLQEAI